MSGMESQHSQASLFSGSEAANSLELFSQPLNQGDNVTGSSASVGISGNHSDSLSQPPLDMVRRMPIHLKLSLIPVEPLVDTLGTYLRFHCIYIPLYSIILCKL